MKSISQDSNREADIKLTNHRKFLLIVTVLASAIGVVGTIHWVTGFRGDLLWVAGVALVFLLVGVLILMLPRRSAAERLGKLANGRDHITPLPWDEPSWYDSSHPGSPFYRRD